MEPIETNKIWTREQSTPSQKKHHILREIRQKQIEEQPKRIKNWYKANRCWLKKKKKETTSLAPQQKKVMYRVNAETKAKKAREKDVKRGVREFLKNEERASQWEREFGAIIQ
jgi:hypothetical protein